MNNNDDNNNNTNKNGDAVDDIPLAQPIYSTKMTASDKTFNDIFMDGETYPSGELLRFQRNESIIFTSIHIEMFHGLSNY